MADFLVSCSHHTALREKELADFDPLESSQPLR